VGRLTDSEQVHAVKHEFCYQCSAPYPGPRGITRVGNTAHERSCPHHLDNIRVGAYDQGMLDFGDGEDYAPRPTPATKKPKGKRTVRVNTPTNRLPRTIIRRPAIPSRRRVMNPWSPPQTNGGDIIPPDSDLEDDDTRESLARLISTARTRVSGPYQMKRRIPEERIPISDSDSDVEEIQNRGRGDSARVRGLKRLMDEGRLPRDPDSYEGEEERDGGESDSAEDRRIDEVLRAVSPSTLQLIADLGRIPDTPATGDAAPPSGNGERQSGSRLRVYEDDEHLYN
jgi:hypothetical protein